LKSTGLRNVYPHLIARSTKHLRLPGLVPSLFFNPFKPVVKQSKNELIALLCAVAVSRCESLGLWKRVGPVAGVVPDVCSNVLTEAGLLPRANLEHQLSLASRGRSPDRPTHPVLCQPSRSRCMPHRPLRPPQASISASASRQALPAGGGNRAPSPCPSRLFGEISRLSPESRSRCEKARKQMEDTTQPFRPAIQCRGLSGEGLFPDLHGAARRRPDPPQRGLAG